MKSNKDTPPNVPDGDSPVPLDLELQQLKDSRRAALNLMEDAIQSRQAMETLNGQLRESEERYRTLFDLGPVAVYSCDASGMIQQFNRQAVELWGREPALRDADERFCGSFKMFRPDGSVMPHEQCPMAEVVSGKISEVRDAEVLIERPDGSRVIVIVNIRQLKSQQGDITGAVNCFYDITDRKKWEMSLHQLNDQLETEVAARTRELVYSHERLRALATELNLTEQRERKNIAAELHDHLAQLLVIGKLKLGQTRRLTESPQKFNALIAETDELLSDALAYTRTLVVELSPPILYEFGLPAALKWLGEGMQRHGLAVTVHSETAPLTLPDDQAVPLFQSIRELLMNAAKHARSGKATVRLEWRSGELRIEVCDHGIGFDPAAAGTSLQFGLFSIRERMSALGGRFELDSTPGQGTMATLVLPLGGAAAASSEVKVLSAQGKVLGTQDFRTQPSELRTQDSALQQDAKIRILLVDDHAMVRQGLRSVLESYPDVEIVGEACNGEQAVAAAEALQPTVVLMDINMPEMNGIQATELIKVRSPNRIVIGLSVNTSGANAEAMRQAGAAMLLNKEAAVEELYRAIHETLT